MGNKESSPDTMPEIDIKTANLTPLQRLYVQKIAEKNKERARQTKVMRFRAARTGILLACTSISIYIYTINAVKQETFLEEYEEEETKP